jgi:molybdenum cofactor synthesis domain-containing protein
VSASAAVVTVSDRVHAGHREDLSGPAAADILRAAGFDVVALTVVPDEEGSIIAALRGFVGQGVNVVATTGGTGFAARDVTPEATLKVVEKQAPGLPELMRARGSENTPLAALSRAVAGSAGRTLILNLPGSPKGVKESLEAVGHLLQHAVDVLAGKTDHAPAEGNK